MYSGSEVLSCTCYIYFVVGVKQQLNLCWFHKEYAYEECTIEGQLDCGIFPKYSTHLLFHQISTGLVSHYDNFVHSVPSDILTTL